MKCNFCGAELRESDAFCSTCGARTADGAQSGDLLEPKPKKKIGIAVTAVICVIAVVVGIVAGIAVGVGVLGNATPDTTGTSMNSYTADDAALAAAREDVVAVMGEYKLTNGLLQAYYYDQIAIFMNDYGYYLSYVGLDDTVALDQQLYPYGENMTWQEFFLESAITSWQQHKVLEMLAQEDGYEMSQDLKDFFSTLRTEMDSGAQESGFADADALIQDAMGAGCGFDEYETFQREYYCGMEYFYSEYDKINPTDAEIEAYYTENEQELVESGYGKEDGYTVDVRHVLIQPEGCEFDTSGYVIATEDQWEACRQQGQALLDAWVQAGATEDGFAQLAVEHSVDGNAEQGGIYEGVTTGYMVETFDAWIFDEARAYGDYGLVKTDFGYHLMFFVGRHDIWYEYARDALISDTLSAWLVEQMDANPVETNYDLIKVSSLGFGEVISATEGE